MKKLFFLLLILFLRENAFAQSSMPRNQLDSLLKIWNNEAESDTNRFKAMNTISWDGYIYTKPDSAFYFAQLLFDFAVKKGDKVYQAAALGTQGTSLNMQGNLKGAVGYFDKSLSMLEAIGDQQGIIAIHINLGSLLRNLGDYTGAIDHLLNAIKMCKKSGDKKALLSAYNNLGIIYANQGDTEKSLDYYSKCLKMATELSDKRGTASVLKNMGIIYENEGEFDKALDFFLKSLKTEQETGNKRGIATSYISFGNTYKDQGDFTKAIEYFFKSLQLMEEMGNKQGIATCNMSIGNIYYNLGDFAKATDYHLNGLKIYEETGDKRGITQSLINIGNTYFDRGKFTLALNTHTRALKTAAEMDNKVSMAVSLNTIGNIYKIKGDSCFFKKNYVPAGKMYTMASENINRSLKLARETNSAKEIATATFALAHLYITTDSVDQAHKKISELNNIRDKDLNVNFSVLSELQKELYFNTMRQDYDLCYDFALQQQKSFPEITDRCYNNALMLKGLLLKSSTAMRNSILNSGDSVLTKKYTNWIALKRRIAKVYSTGGDTKELEEQANEMEKELVKGSMEFSDIKKIQELTWKDVQKNLEKDEYAIEFIRFKHQDDYRIDSVKTTLYAALVIDKNSQHPKMIRLFEEQQLEKIIGSFPGNNISYIEQLYGSKQNTRSQLYDLIWKPMEKELKGAKKVYVSPDGLLHKIALAALAKNQDVYLCDLYKVETPSSTGTIALRQPGFSTKNASVTIFGGINYNADSTSKVIWKYLDGTLSETQQLEKILKNKKIKYTCFTQNTATEQQFKKTASSSSVIHIATHGFFFPDPDEIKLETSKNEVTTTDVVFRGASTGFGAKSFVESRNPLMRSGLIFAGANDIWTRKNQTNDSTYKEDGILTAQEVMAIDMRKTSLVVLSACETGLGDIKGSEGVYGLQRALKMAGVNSIIMSLWQVPDKETAEFMDVFYKKLFVDGNIKQAFLETRHELRKKYDPYYWAAFVLIE